MRFLFDSCPKNQESLPVHLIIIFFPCHLMHSWCFPLTYLPVLFGSALHSVVQFNHALYGAPRTFQSEAHGAVVAVSPMAHRHRNLSQSQRTLCRSQMHSGLLYPQPASARRLGILPLSLTRTVVFERRK